MTANRRMPHRLARRVACGESVACLQMAQPTSDGMNGACELDCAAIGDCLRAENRRPYKSWRFLMPFDLCRRAQPVHLTSQKIQYSLPERAAVWHRHHYQSTDSQGPAAISSSPTVRSQRSSVLGLSAEHAPCQRGLRTATMINAKAPQTRFRVAGVVPFRRARQVRTGEEEGGARSVRDLTRPAA